MMLRSWKKTESDDERADRPGERDPSLLNAVVDLASHDPSALVLTGVVLTGFAGATVFRLWRTKGPGAGKAAARRRSRR